MKDKLKAVLDKFNHDGKNYIQYLSSSPPADEAVVRQKIILPILTDLLEYDLQKDINPEDRVGNGFIDVLVKVDNNPILIIELKRSSELDLKRHLPQLARYVKGKGVKYGMLTNGRKILIYDFYVSETIPIFTINLESFYLQELSMDNPIIAFETLFSNKAFKDIRKLQIDIIGTASAARPYIMNRENPQNDTILIDGLKVLIEGLKNLVKLRFVQYEAEDAAFKQDDEQKRDSLSALKEKLILSVKKAANGNDEILMPALYEVLSEFEKNWRDFKTKERRLERVVSEIPQKLALDKEKTLKKILEEIIRVYGDLTTTAFDADKKKTLAALKKRERIIKTLGEFLVSEKAERTAKLNEILTLIKKDWHDVGFSVISEAVKGIKTASGVFLNIPEVMGDARWYEREFIKYQEWFSSEDLRLRPVEQLLKSFRHWRHQLGVIGTEDKEGEFCLQTVYIFIIRILLIRIFEDKDLVSQKISDGGYKTTEEFLSKLMVYVKDVNRIILDLSYKDAGQIYGHFFVNDIFDWYAWEEESIVKVFHHLNRFDFKEVGSDLIGKIYEQYVDIIERRNKGQFYTPGEVVNYILDGVGYKGPEIIGKRLLDPACGSGRFLVEAARRLVSELKHLPLSPDELINERLRDSLFGLDINRFACFLAEVNILIQILDLVPKQSGGKAFTIRRFHVYPANTLIPSDERTYGLASMFEMDYEMAETIKAREHTPELGYDFTTGFDFVVGNPPYVKANRPGVEAGRYEIKETRIYETLHKRWDLYIPFIEFALKNLAAEGRFSFIVPDSYPTVDYAGPSREMLLSNCTVEALTFIPGMKLFEGADVYNFIFSVSKKPLPSRHQVKRFKWLQKTMEVGEMGQQILHDEIGELKPLSQRRWGEKVFRMEFEGETELEDVTKIGEICYVTRGAELQANEKYYRNEFIKDDLISFRRTKANSKPYVEGKDIDRYHISSKRWLEWDTDRVPHRVRRPTFPELYENIKIIVGKSSGAIYDEEKFFSDQSGVIIMPYFELQEALKIAAEIKEDKLRSDFSYGNLLADEVKEKIETGAGEDINLKYLLVLINSNPLREYFVKQIASGDTRSITPDDWRKFPVKLISREEQGVFAGFVDEIMELKAVVGKDISLKSLLDEKQVPIADLIDASSFVKTNIDNNFSLSACLLEENRLILKKSPLYYLESSFQDVLKYLHLFISENMAELKNLTSSDFLENVRMPKTSGKVAEVLAIREQAINQVELIKLRINEIDDEMDERVIRLYELKNASVGRLYIVEDLPETAQHVIIRKSMEAGEIDQPCFRLDGQWVTRSVKRIPRYATVVWWDGEWHEGKRFIGEK